LAAVAVVLGAAVLLERRLDVGPDVTAAAPSDRMAT